MAYISAKDTQEIQDKLVEWLNDNLDDPYEQATSKKRDSFVYGEDFKLVPIFPKVHVSAGDYVPNKVSTHGKTDYLEEEEHHFFIYYHNQLAHRYKFENGETLNNERQNRKYLQYIKDELKTRMTDFDEYFHKPTFGTINKPVFNKKVSCWVGMIPLTVFTYKR